MQAAEKMGPISSSQIPLRMSYSQKLRKIKYMYPIPHVFFLKIYEGKLEKAKVTYEGKLEKAKARLLKYGEVEEHFEIEGENFVINGFIDKKAFYKNKIDIWDYKSSKARFNKEEIESNYQALMYSLATFKQDGIIPEVKFLFLRFPDRAEQAALVDRIVEEGLTRDQLRALRHEAEAKPTKKKPGGSSAERRRLTYHSGTGITVTLHLNGDQITVPEIQSALREAIEELDNPPSS